MTEIDFKGKKYQLKDFTYGQYRRLLAARKQAIDSKDEWLIIEALDKLVKTLTNVTEEDMENWKFPEDVVKFVQLIGESQTLPLPPKENSDEPSSPTPPG